LILIYRIHLLHERMRQLARRQLAAGSWRGAAAQQDYRIEAGEHGGGVRDAGEVELGPAGASDGASFP
jgi:hypothetical protein